MLQGVHIFSWSRCRSYFKRALGGGGATRGRVNIYETGTRLISCVLVTVEEDSVDTDQNARTKHDRIIVNQST